MSLLEDEAPLTNAENEAVRQLASEYASSLGKPHPAKAVGVTYAIGDAKQACYDWFGKQRTHHPVRVAERSTCSRGVEPDRSVEKVIL